MYLEMLGDKDVLKMSKKVANVQTLKGLQKSCRTIA